MLRLIILSTCVLQCYGTALLLYYLTHPNDLNTYYTYPSYSYDYLSELPNIISIDDDGKLNLDFLGFKVSTGLGPDGISAEAETPFGQKASGSIGEDGIKGEADALPTLGVSAEAGGPDGPQANIILGPNKINLDDPDDPDDNVKLFKYISEEYDSTTETNKNEITLSKRYTLIKNEHNSNEPNVGTLVHPNSIIETSSIKTAKKILHRRTRNAVNDDENNNSHNVEVNIKTKTSSAEATPLLIINKYHQRIRDRKHHRLIRPQQRIHQVERTRVIQKDIGALETPSVVVSTSHQPVNTIAKSNIHTNQYDTDINTDPHGTPLPLHGTQLTNLGLDIPIGILQAIRNAFNRSGSN